MRADRRGWMRGYGLVSARSARVFGLLAFLAVGLVGGRLAFGHTPNIDADLSDWCLFTEPRVENSAAELTCAFGTERVWWDAPANAVVNDLATVATTQDANNLYWAAELHVDPDPVSVPFAQIAIEIAPGGGTTWWDPGGVLGSNAATPGHCSVDTERLCAVNEDCHFCTNSTIYTGTANERPRPCGSTNGIDSCDDFDDTDLCIRTQTCVDLGVGPPVPGVGQNASPAVQPDYLLVFDFGRWVLNFCDATVLKRNDNGSWVEIPRAVPDPLCNNPTWKFLPAVDPGATGGSGGPPGKIELAVPWEAFNCAGCVPFGPGTEFSWVLSVSRGLVGGQAYVPFGAIEDVPTEPVAGSETSSPDSCPQPGTASLLCELADGSVDGFALEFLPASPGGSVEETLRIQRNTSGSATPEITMTWSSSCSALDTDYEVYAGDLDLLPTYSHVPVPSPNCTTGGATRATFNTGSGNEYYLVVPTDLSTSGSYGLTDVGGPQRPFSTSACTPQSLGTCP